MPSMFRPNVSRLRIPFISSNYILPIIYLVILAANAQERVPTWEELIKDQILVELNLQFVLNFTNSIFDVIVEGQQFERHGFVLSPVIRRAIMRKVNEMQNKPF